MFTKTLIGTTGDYAPFSTRCADGSYHGFDIELIELIIPGSKTYAHISWHELEAKLIDGFVDCLASGITVTPARQQIGLFTQPYLINQTVVVAPQGMHQSIIRLGVNRGGYLESVARTRFPNQQIITVNKNENLPRALLAGEFDAFLSDAIEAKRFCAEFGLRIAERLEKQAHALMLRKELVALKSQIDTSLAQLNHSGRLQQLAAKHGIDSDHVPRA